MKYPDHERFVWFEEHARTIIGSCRRVAASVPGWRADAVAVYVPGGDDKYPSFWIRDAVMQCRSGLIPEGEMLDMLRIMLRFQNGPQVRRLANGLRVTPWAFADHINLPGLGEASFTPPGAVFYPGTYQSGDDQGTGRFGFRPADDDVYEVIELTALLTEQLGEAGGRELLAEEVEGMAVLERLLLGFEAMPVDKATGLPRNRPDDWAAASFHDALIPMGLIAFTGVLRARAATRLSRLCALARRQSTAIGYRRMATSLGEALARELQRPDGWLNMATEVNRQPDLWATSMALYEEVLPEDAARKAGEALLAACRAATIVDPTSGYLRHTPITADVAPGRRIYEHQVEDGPCDTYQTGGYWPQCIGFVCWALHRVDPQLANELAVAFIDHTRRHIEEGAPVEWLYPGAELPANGRLYGPSAALPLAAFRRLSQVEKQV